MYNNEGCALGYWLSSLRGYWLSPLRGCLLSALRGYPLSFFPSLLFFRSSQTRFLAFSSRLV